MEEAGPSIADLELELREIRALEGRLAAWRCLRIWSPRLSLARDCYHAVAALATSFGKKAFRCVLTQVVLVQLKTL